MRSMSSYSDHLICPAIIGLCLKAAPSTIQWEYGRHEAEISPKIAHSEEARNFLIQFLK